MSIVTKKRQIGQKPGWLWLTRRYLITLSISNAALFVRGEPQTHS